MLHLDEQALEDAFWSIDLSYDDGNGIVVLTDDQKLVVNQPNADIDETKPWVKFAVVPGDSALDATGTNPTYKQVGSAVLNIFVPNGFGLSAAKQLRDQFTVKFRAWTSDDGRCSVFYIGNNTVENTSNTQVRVTAMWESLRHPS